MEQSYDIEKLLKFLFWEDVLLLLFGIYIGATVVVVLVCVLHMKTVKIDNKHFEKLSFIRIYDDNGTKRFLINNSKSNTIFEAMRGLVLMIFSLLFTSSDYVVKSKKRAKSVTIITIIASVISILVLIAIVNILPFVFFKL